MKSVSQVMDRFILLVVFCAVGGCEGPGRPATGEEFPDGEALQQFTCSGIAHDAKLGAVIVRENLVYYVSELDAWPPEALGKLVEVTGDLVVIKDVPDPVVDEYGGVSSGMVGPRAILLNAKWRIISCVE